MCDKKMTGANIVLIGFMGTGKTTVCKALKKQFHMNIVEMDEEIARREQLSISEIFHVHGEEYFRDAETRLLTELQTRKNTVISCGGGTPLREENVVRMKNIGQVILLTASAQTILERVKRSHARPLIEANKNIEFVTEMLEKRRPYYESAADYIISTDNKTMTQICKEIEEAWKQREEMKG